MVVNIDQDKFAKEVLEYQGVVLVDFYADWCGPCRMMAPIFDELSQEVKEVKFVKVNVDNNPDLASQYSVFSIPTFVFFKNGKMVSQIVGGKSKESFLEEIKKIINNK